MIDESHREVSPWGKVNAPGRPRGDRGDGAGHPAQAAGPGQRRIRRRHRHPSKPLWPTSAPARRCPAARTSRPA